MGKRGSMVDLRNKRLNILKKKQATGSGKAFFSKLGISCNIQVSKSSAVCAAAESYSAAPVWPEDQFQIDMSQIEKLAHHDIVLS